VRIERVEIPLEVTSREVAKIAFEIAVNVVRVILVFHKRTINKNPINAGLPELAYEQG